MNLKKIYYIFLLIVFYLLPGPLYGQPVFDLTIKDNLKSLTVDSMTIEEKIAFLLLPYEEYFPVQDSKEKSGWKNPVIPSNTILNVIDGFHEERVSSQFPD